MATPLLYSIAAVSLNFTVVVELHPGCLLELKGQNVYMGTYRVSNHFCFSFISGIIYLTRVSKELADKTG